MLTTKRDTTGFDADDQTPRKQRGKTCSRTNEVWITWINDSWFGVKRTPPTSRRVKV